MVSQSPHLPNFFVLGARRSGTGSLAHYLSQHPAITFTNPTDHAFFLDDELHQQGLDYYGRTFCAPTVVKPWLGEASSPYFAHPHIIGPRLREGYGDAPLRFIVLLREPVSRAWSHYLSRVHQGYETRDFPTALAEEADEPHHSQARYFEDGRYTTLLEAWQSYYPLENFLFLLSEDLAANPLAQAQRVFAWLGVDSTPIKVSKRFNTAHYCRSPRIVALLNNPPSWLDRLSKQIWPETWQRQRVRRRLCQYFQVTYGALPPLDPAISAQLRQRYRSDIIALSRLLGRYLTHWLAEEPPRPNFIPLMAF